MVPIPHWTLGIRLKRYYFCLRWHTLLPFLKKIHRQIFNKWMYQIISNLYLKVCKLYCFYYLSIFIQIITLFYKILNIHRPNKNQPYCIWYMRYNSLPLILSVHVFLNGLASCWTNLGLVFFSRFILVWVLCVPTVIAALVLTAGVRNYQIGPTTFDNHISMRLQDFLVNLSASCYAVNEGNIVIILRLW